MNELFVIAVSIGLINITSQFVFKKKIFILAMKDLWTIFFTFFEIEFKQINSHISKCYLFYFQV